MSNASASPDVAKVLKAWRSQSTAKLNEIGITRVEERYLQDENGAVPHKGDKAYLGFEAAAFVASITVWGSGSVDFDFMAGKSVSRSDARYYSFTGEAELSAVLDRCLDDLTALVAGQGLFQPPE